MNIGFIGIGRMGRPIVERLIAAGHILSVFDVDPQASARCLEVGAKICRSPAAIGADNGLTFICVPGPKEVDAVLSGADGLFSSIRAGSVIVEMSTIGPAQGRALADRAASLAVVLLDAPLSGGEAGAASGELTAMVGGNEQALAGARPYLECFCSRIYHLGGSGSGYLAKAINQIIYLSYVASFSEAVALGKRAGLDVPVLLDALRASVAGRPLSTGWETRVASGDMSPGFQVRRVVKDLEMGEEACREISFEADIFFGVMKAFRDLANLGFAEDDMTALFQLKSGSLPTNQFVR